MSINVDIEPFFNSLNQYLPVFLGIFGMIGGIAGAVLFSRFLVRYLKNALSG